MHTSLKCVNILNIINYMCSELVAKLSTQFTLYKPYNFSTFLYFFILAFLLESINTFLSFRYIFHLLIDYLSISKHDTVTCEKGYKKELQAFRLGFTYMFRKELILKNKIFIKNLSVEDPYKKKERKRKC